MSFHRTLGSLPVRIARPMTARSQTSWLSGLGAMISAATSTIAPSPSFASLVRRLPVPSGIDRGGAQRAVQVILNRTQAPIYRAGALLAMLTGDRRYANDPNLTRLGYMQSVTLSRRLGLSDEAVGWLLAATNSTAFEAAALAILQMVVRRADAFRSVGPAYGGRLSGLGAVLAVM